MRCAVFSDGCDGSDDLLHLLCSVLHVGVQWVPSWWSEAENGRHIADCSRSLLLSLLQEV